MKIYTKGGDKGETGLFGGERVSKNSPRIEAYGTIDELNSFIGLAVIEISDDSVKQLLIKIQNHLFTIGSDLASPDTEKNRKFNIPRTPAAFHEELEKAIDHYDSQNDELRNFILPGGTRGAALLHICRTITRRAERRVVELTKDTQITGGIIIYLNRLSDLFFVLARYQNKTASTPDTPWKP